LSGLRHAILVSYAIQDVQSSSMGSAATINSKGAYYDVQASVFGAGKSRQFELVMAGVTIVKDE